MSVVFLTFSIDKQKRKQENRLKCISLVFLKSDTHKEKGLVLRILHFGLVSKTQN